MFKQLNFMVWIFEYLRYEDKIFTCISVKIVVLTTNSHWHIISVDINCLWYWSRTVMLCWTKSIGVCNTDGFLSTDKPGAPGTPKCSAYTPDSITLEWTPPKKDGGNPIKGYQVEKREAGETKWTK